MVGVEETVRDFRAMGSECSVRVVVGDGRGEPLLDRAVELVADLERRWSRFVADSELVQLNEHAGAPVFLSPETFAVVALAVEAWRATGGRFDPTLLDALVDAGYDRDFAAVRDRRVEVAPADATPRSGVDRTTSHPLDRVELDARTAMVHAPAGLHLDLGGIGKGRAADLVYTQLMEDGATGACVDLGGDLRLGGSTAEGTGWAVVVDDPFRPGADLAVVGLTSGAVTTSSTHKRRWPTSGGEAHHLLDPRTAAPARTDLLAVTVLAAEAAWGEAHSKAALVAGRDEGRALIERAGLSALFVDGTGATETVGSFADFVLG